VRFENTLDVIEVLVSLPQGSAYVPLDILVGVLSGVRIIEFRDGRW
jgi:hypothetical protein